MRVSYLEIYNENVNDLLDPNRKALEIRDAYNRVATIIGLNEPEAKTLDDALTFFKAGDD